MFKDCLLKDTVERAGCQVVGRLAGYSHTARLALVF